MAKKQLPDYIISQLGRRLQKIFNEKFSESFLNKILALILENISENPDPGQLWSEKDIILITYGNSIVDGHSRPLEALKKFYIENLEDEITTVHVLPFFPYSSDDGFSVIDYYKVNPDLGTWEDVNLLGKQANLMFDLVINHVSRQSSWFKQFLNDEAPGKDYFIVPEAGDDLSKVIRPRSTSLLTAYKTVSVTKKIWTTFSADQVDLNCSNPDVLYEMLKVLLFYIRQGARIIRLDAIAFLWKQPGTTCLHLPETHEIVKLLRDVTDVIDPRVILLTETNVPNKENLSYFGKGDEAHMVYQFSLPPLLLHALNTGNSNYLVQWVKTISDTLPKTTYFNFTASHDGIGVRPLEGLLPSEEIMALVGRMQAFGGKVSYKSNADGTQSPYEINITYFDAMKGYMRNEDEFQAQRFICSQAIMISLKGIPAFYIHSLLATNNDYVGVEKTGRARSINRKVLDYEELKVQLQQDRTKATVFNELKKLVRLRKEQPAFHPDAGQEVVEVGDGLFCIKRISEKQELWAISNLSNHTKTLEIEMLKTGKKLKDIISGSSVTTSNLGLNPYQTVWLR